jgi:prepilin-type N-terminal cleavage/methylation domain-containing protein
VKRGFTIVELLVVVSIITLLMGVLLPAISHARDGARVSQSKSNLRQLGLARKAYDGSVRLMSVLEAMSSDHRAQRQSSDGEDLWTRDTPFGADGYLIPASYDFADSSFHILTTEGVRGRDTLGSE